MDGFVPSCLSPSVRACHGRFRDAPSEETQVDKFVKFPVGIPAIVGVAVIAIAAVVIAKRLPVVKTLV